MTTITEAHVEQAALDWLAELGWEVAHGVDISGDGPAALRDDVSQVVLDAPLRDAPAHTCAVWFRRLLRMHGYPPDKQEKAARTALEQAEVLSEGWAYSV